MDMQGNRSLKVERQQAWEALNDPQVLMACIPGCDRIEEQGSGEYAIRMSVKVGPVSARFAGTIQLRDVEPPSSYRLKFEGQGGAAGFGRGEAKVWLEPSEAGCELNYTAHAQVGGKIAQVGQRLIDGVAHAMAEDFFKRFESELERRHVSPTLASDNAVPAIGGAGGRTSASATLGGMLAWAWVVAILIIAGLAFWLF